MQRRESDTYPPQTPQSAEQEMKHDDRTIADYKETAK